MITDFSQYGSQNDAPPYVQGLIEEHSESLTSFSWDGVGSQCFSI